MIKPVDIRISINQSRHSFSSVANFDKVNEISYLVGYAKPKNHKANSKHKKELKEVFFRIKNVEAKYKQVVEQYTQDASDINKLSSYYRAKGSSKKEFPPKTQLHSHFGNAEEISGSSVKLANALNDLVNAVGDLFESLRFVVAENMDKNPNKNLKSFISNSGYTGVLASNKITNLWNKRKHQSNLSINSLSYDFIDNSFTEPTISESMSFDGLTINEFLDSILDETIQVLRELKNE